MRSAYLLLLLGFGAHAAQVKPDVVFAWPNSSDSLVTVDPGESAQRTLLITNEGGVESLPVSIRIKHSILGRLGDEYYWRSLTPAVCSDPEPTFNSSTVVVHPIAAATRVSCRFEIRRDAASYRDIILASEGACFWMEAQATCYPLGLRLGTLPDLTLRITPVAPVFVGDTEALVRATVTNPSNVAIAGPGFGACSHQTFPRFEWTTDFEGACSEDYGPLCFGSGWGFRVPDVPAGGESSCLIRLTFAPIRQSNIVGVVLEQELSTADGTRFLMDPRMWNGQGALGVSPLAREPAVVPMSSASRAVLVLLVLSLGLVRLAQRGRDGA